MTNRWHRFVDFLRAKKKVIRNLLLTLLLLVGISVGFLFLFLGLDILHYEGTDLVFNEVLFDSFKNAWYGWALFILLQIVLTMLLCFIPGVSMAFIILSEAMYDHQWEAFLLCFISVLVASSVMYLLGRVGGYKLCVRLLGEEDCEKALLLLKNRGTVYFPVMMLFPMFPDEALTMVAGTMKMSLKWFIPSIVVARGIGIATIVFGLGSLPLDRFTWVHWLIFLPLCVVGVVAVFWLAHRLNVYLQKKNQSAQPEE